MKYSCALQAPGRITLNYPLPLSNSLVVLFDVTKLEHPIPVALRSRDSLLELLRHLWVRRKVLASLAIDRCETFANQIHVDRRKRIFCRRRIRGVNESEVKCRTLFVVDVGDQLTPVTQLAEAVNCVLSVFAFLANEFYKAALRVNFLSCRPSRKVSHLRRASCAWPGSVRNLGSSGRMFEKPIVSWLP